VRKGYPEGSVRGERVFVLRPAEAENGEKSLGASNPGALLVDGKRRGLSGVYSMVCTAEEQKEKRPGSWWRVY